MTEQKKILKYKILKKCNLTIQYLAGDIEEDDIKELKLKLSALVLTINSG